MSIEGVTPRSEPLAALPLPEQIAALQGRIHALKLCNLMTLAKFDTPAIDEAREKLIAQLFAAKKPMDGAKSERILTYAYPEFHHILDATTESLEALQTLLGDQPLDINKVKKA